MDSAANEQNRHNDKKFPTLRRPCYRKYCIVCLLLDLQRSTDTFFDRSAAARRRG